MSEFKQRIVKTLCAMLLAPAFVVASPTSPAQAVTYDPVLITSMTRLGVDGVTLTFSTPVNTGGYPLKTITITTSPFLQNYFCTYTVGTAPLNSCNILKLTPNTIYQFATSYTNTSGFGPVAYVDPNGKYYSPPVATVTNITGSISSSGTTLTFTPVPGAVSGTSYSASIYDSATGATVASGNNSTGTILVPSASTLYLPSGHTYYARIVTNTLYGYYGSPAQSELSVPSNYFSTPEPLGKPTAVSATLIPPTPGGRISGLNFSIAFTPPVNLGIKPIIGYYIAAYKNGISLPSMASGLSSPISLTIPTAGTTEGSYQFQVFAQDNSYFQGPKSDSSTAIVVLQPDTPTATVLAGDTILNVTPQAAATGPSPTSYGVTAYSGDLTTPPQVTFTNTIPATPIIPTSYTCQVIVPATSCTLKGLTNDQIYTMWVSANNEYGSNAMKLSLPIKGTPVGAVVIPSAPSTPAQPTVSVNGGLVTVSVTPLSPLPTTYTITANPGGITQTITAPDTSTVFGTLDPGTTYSFTASATNAGGTSGTSSAITATPIGVPGAPTITGVTTSATSASLGSASVSFTAPTSNGGASISSYTATAYLNGVATNLSASGSSSPLTITGLTQGQFYTFVVTATNSQGISSGSAQSSVAQVTPAPTPSAPTAVSATTGATTATVSFTMPSNPVGGSISGVSVTATNVSNGQQTTETASATSSTTSFSFTGLTIGSAYTFTVAASNSSGLGTSSAASSVVSTAAVPGAPTGVRTNAVFSSANATFWWSAPASNGGSSITNYVITGHHSATTAGVDSFTVPASPDSATVVLTNIVSGATYYDSFTVSAVNAAGTSLPSSAVVMVAGQPGAVTAFAGDGEAHVVVSVTSVPGVPETYTVYTYSSNDPTKLIPGATCVALASFPYCTISGLTNGVTYYFAAKGNNSSGSSALGGHSAGVTPVSSKPGTPTNVTATMPAGSETATVSWNNAVNHGLNVEEFNIGHSVSADAITPDPKRDETTYTRCGVGQVSNIDAMYTVVSGGNTTGITGCNTVEQYFLLHYTGFITMPGTYNGTDTQTVTFGSRSDDGVHGNLYNLDGTAVVTAKTGNAIIDKWEASAPYGAAPRMDDTSTVTVKKGGSYILDYWLWSNVGNAEAHLYWLYSGIDTYTVIPADAYSLTKPITNETFTVTATSNSGETLTITAAAGSTSATFPGLSAGKSYIFSVIANGSGGSSAQSSASNVVSNIPSAPTVSVTAGTTAGSAVLTLITPTSNTGGSALSYYTITTTPTTSTQTVVASSGSTTTATIYNLAPSTAYTVSVTSTNGIGTSASTTSSITIAKKTLYVLPDPQTVSVGTATLTFTRLYKLDTTSATIVDPIIANTGFVAPTCDKASTPFSSSTPVGTYSIVCSSGDGGSIYNLDYSNSETLTVVSTTPQAPTGVIATLTGTTATITFNAPTSGPTPTSYYVAVYSGAFPTGETKTVTTAGPNTISNLVPTSSYSFAVYAVNGAYKQISALSNTVTVSKQKLYVVPTNVSVTQGTASANFTYVFQTTLGDTSTVTVLEAGNSGYSNPTCSPDPAYSSAIYGGIYVISCSGGNGGALYSLDTSATAILDVIANIARPFAPATASVTNTTSSSATVTFTAPTVTTPVIGTPITSYTVYAFPGGASATTSSATPAPLTISGLSPSTNYSFQVVATNSSGNSAPTSTYAATLAAAITGGGSGGGTGGGASGGITPALLPPSTPTNVVATLGGNLGSQYASVAFSVTPTLGVTTSYTVTAQPGGLTASGTGSPIRINGLTPGVNYTFTVTATNSAGNSASSTASSQFSIPVVVANPYTQVPGSTTPGSSAVLLNGVPQNIPLTRIIAANVLKFAAKDWNLQLSAYTQNSGLTTPTAALQLVGYQGANVGAEGSGFAPKSTIAIYLFSKTYLLGTHTTDDNGNFSIVEQMPKDLTPGEHTVQVVGYTPEGQVRTASVKVTVKAAVSPTPTASATPKPTTTKSPTPTPTKTSSSTTEIGIANSASTKIYFNLNTSFVDAPARATLKKFVAAILKKHSGPYTISVVGMVEPTPVNPLPVATLSKARATATAKLLKEYGLSGKYTIKGGGLAAKRGAASRYAQVIVTWQE